MMPSRRDNSVIAGASGYTGADNYKGATGQSGLSGKNGVICTTSVS